MTSERSSKTDSQTFRMALATNRDTRQNCTI